MIIKTDYISLEDHTPWSGAKYNYNLIKQSGTGIQFMEELEEIYPEGLTETELNDILWFEDGFCYQYVKDTLLSEEELKIKKEYMEG